MKYSTKRMLAILGGLIFFILGVFIFQNFVAPLKTDIKKIRGEILKKEEFYQTQYQAKTQLEDLLNQIQNLENFKNNLDKILPHDDSRVIEVLKTIQGLVELNKLDLKNFNFKEKGYQDVKTQFNFIKKLNKVELNLNLYGNYDNIKNFLSNLENNLRVMNIKSLIFKNISNNSYELGLVVEFYYQK